MTGFKTLSALHRTYFFIYLNGGAQRSNALQLKKTLTNGTSTQNRKEVEENTTETEKKKNFFSEVLQFFFLLLYFVRFWSIFLLAVRLTFEGHHQF